MLIFATASKHRLTLLYVRMRTPIVIYHQNICVICCCLCILFWCVLIGLVFNSFILHVVINSVLQNSNFLYERSKVLNNVSVMKLSGILLRFYFLDLF